MCVCTRGWVCVHAACRGRYMCMCATCTHGYACMHTHGSGCASAWSGVWLVRMQHGHTCIRVCACITHVCSTPVCAGSWFEETRPPPPEWRPFAEQSTAPSSCVPRFRPQQRAPDTRCHGHGSRVGWWQVHGGSPRMLHFPAVFLLRCPTPPPQRAHRPPVRPGSHTRPGPAKPGPGHHDSPGRQSFWAHTVGPVPGQWGAARQTPVSVPGLRCLSRSSANSSVPGASGACKQTCIRCGPEAQTKPSTQGLLRDSALRPRSSGAGPPGEAPPPAPSQAMPAVPCLLPEVKSPARHPQGPGLLGQPGTPGVPSLAWPESHCRGSGMSCLLWAPRGLGVLSLQIPHAREVSSGAGTLDAALKVLLQRRSLVGRRRPTGRSRCSEKAGSPKPHPTTAPSLLGSQTPPPPQGAQPRGGAPSRITPVTLQTQRTGHLLQEAFLDSLMSRPGAVPQSIDRIHCTHLCEAPSAPDGKQSRRKA